MIKKKGKVIISEDGILVTGFHFIKESNLALCRAEALRWAHSKLCKGLQEDIKEGLKA